MTSPKRRAATPPALAGAFGLALHASAALAQAPPAPQSDTGGLALSAVFAGDGRPIVSGLVWRIFPDGGEEAGRQPLARSTEPSPVFTLSAGSYLVHVSYGLAGTVRRVSIGPRGATERVTLNAGGLRLAGAINGAPLPANRLGFSVYAPLSGNAEGKLVAANVKAGEVVRLPEGVYHVVSNYGDTNANARSDLRVESGRVLEAVMNHRAATVTLKLVAAAGGEALAGTAFSVLTPGGDVIREAIGAFPAMILAEGDYVVIARLQGQVYTRPFKVDSGLDREIEVMAR